MAQLMPPEPIDEAAARAAVPATAIRSAQSERRFRPQPSAGWLRSIRNIDVGIAHCSNETSRRFLPRHQDALRASVSAYEEPITRSTLSANRELMMHVKCPSRSDRSNNSTSALGLPDPDTAAFARKTRTRRLSEARGRCRGRAIPEHIALTVRRGDGGEHAFRVALPPAVAGACIDQEAKHRLAARLPT
jgi:hypothetical protein